MATLFASSFEYQGAAFDVKAECVDEAGEEDDLQVWITVRAMTRDRLVGDAVRIRLADPDKGIEIRHHNEVRQRVPLEQADPQPGWDTIVTDIVGTDGALEKAIDSLPTIDPILVCALKGATLAVVKQIRRCWPVAAREPEWKPRLRALLRCLKANGLGMAAVAGGRTLRCMMGA